MINKKNHWLLWTGLIVVLILYPKVAGIYYTNFFVTFAIFSVFSVSYNFLLGYTGLFSFGHAMFFGTGGYGVALALTHLKGISVLTALGIGMLAAAFLALLLCPLVVRVTGTAFAMLHLAFGQLMYVLALKLRTITGGEDGVGGFPLPPINLGFLSVNIKDSANFYYFALVVLGLSLWIMWFFTKTPFGQIQIGVRDNVKRVDYLGFKVPQTKAVIYVISGAFAGVAGAVYALFQNLISADGGFSVIISFAPIINVMVGGVFSFFGPIWGTALLQIITEITTRYTDRVELVSGLILIGIIMFAPMGFMGFMHYLKQRWLIPFAFKAKSENIS
ncbi:MAG: branched-chain amino acid ABC transporter permease [Desulfobacca sp.]|nr:branched-chain amino acid ABC transporter permease [Desulfobacca sp.]